MSVSPNVVIMTKDELEAIKNEWFLKGVKRGRFEERYEQSNSPAQGLEGHSGATESTGSASADAAVRPANSQEA